MIQTKIIFLILLLSINYIKSQTLKKGDNIYEEFKKLKNLKEIKGPSIGKWVEESEIKMFANKSDKKLKKIIYFSSKDNKIFAVKNSNKDKSFLIAFYKDSILDIESKNLILPYWVIKKKSKILSKDTTVIDLLNKMYEEILQADDNLKIDPILVNKMSQYQTDTSLANRHIIYLFDKYSQIVMQSYSNHESTQDKLCIPIMKSLSSEFIKIYNRIPVIVCVYMGETLLFTGLESKARDHFKTSLYFYPESIPLQVYDFKLERDQNKKKDKLRSLKKNHPNHWMVKGL